MKIKKLTLLILTCLLVSLLFSQKMQLQKHSPINKLRIHPYTQLLKQAPIPSNASKSASFERLLVILVDFPLESPDDTNTTGNGKFQLETDPSYLYSVGAPPHNRQYYEANLEAMKYYYKAVSVESYQLQYDVYPKTQPAYTLPHPMGYYNSPGASSELFVSRMEEYFKTCFETADASDPEIDFASYSHYMIIHAGSDWQHDVNGDTPSDLPSFYIRVNSGKEAVVDNGTVLISHASNVPATISQDFTTSTENGQTVHSGYGALNAVIAHEFGHSLGFVDLYNVSDFRPMVGSFDIMDSGGSGLMVDTLPNGDVVLLEGSLPTMPGAFSRQLAFGNYYQSIGLMKDFTQLPLFTNIELHAVSSKQSGSTLLPEILRIPLNEKEYILVENRNVDPDGDGATAVFGTLDSRVVLYPTPYGDPQNTPSYEYDFMLPSFQKSDGSSVGGGVLVWHVNESILYDEGVHYADGTWVNNFDNNTVNTIYSRRGVRVIEADGLTDIGNDYSMYWTGTQYEYFHARKPVLDANGLFISWSLSPWKPELNASTKPSLLDSYGLAGLYGLSSISNPAKIMSLKLSAGFFDTTKVFNYPSPNMIAGDIINSGFNDFDLPVLSFGSINLLSNINGTWQDVMGTFYDSITTYDYPPQKTDNNSDGYYELVVVSDRALHFLDFADVQLSMRQLSFPSKIIITPLVYNSDVYVATETCLYKLSNFAINNFVELNGALRIAAWDNRLIALGLDFLAIIDANTMQVISRISLPEAFGNNEPIVYQSIDKATNEIFLMSDLGNLYCYNMVSLNKLFTNHSTSLPGQIALSSLGNISPVVFFGIGNQLYALKTDGTILSGFPMLASNKISSSFTPMAMHIGGSDLLYYPLENHGYLAVNANAKAVPEFSLTWNQAPKQDHLYYHAPNGTLYWYYPDATGNLFLHSLSGLDENPILFSGYRNSGSGVFSSAISNPPILNTELSAFVFPNPIKKPDYRIRLLNAEGNTTLRIFDITGALVTKMESYGSANNPRDIEMDASLLSAGVYILSIENHGSYKRVKFAVEK
ncbi:MAG: T9SS type A sorting domain-containing protein [Candidatus Cloacimonetes bacterium]|nr:T9SS type A sorting domain-containing protein [Candidatus Cloacimonadota bacterium]